MAFFTIADNREHLLDPSGQPFFVLGVNYEGYFDRAWRMWEDALFDLDLVTRDLRKAQSSGFNAVRIFAQAPLLDDIRARDFNKLDRVLDEAERLGLAVLLVLNDVHSVQLAAVAELDAMIAGHLQGRSGVLGYELENEPVFYNLVAARYPEGIHAPVQTDALIEHYGERVSRGETEQLQNAGRIPRFLSPDLAYFYINALRLFLEFDQAATAWGKQGNGDLLRFITSPDAAHWRHLVHVMDATLAAWLTARLDPLLAADSGHLVSLGWSWPHFAGLPANRALDFVQFHHYGAQNLGGLRATLDYLQGLRRIFPDHPIILGEFGYSNASSRNPELSRPVDPFLTALYETALLCGLQAEGFAGGFKWMLNDVTGDNHNPWEENFGVFRQGDQPKPLRDLVLRLADLWDDFPAPGTIQLARDANTGLGYRYTLSRSVLVGGGTYQDQTLVWQSQSDRPAHLFVHWDSEEIDLEATGAGRVALDPARLVSGWDGSRQTVLYRRQAGARREVKRFTPDQELAWDALPGVDYLLALGATSPTPPSADDLDELQPGPGEHVLVLPDSDRHLDAALTYIRRFNPDFTFAPEEVDGRWAFVTIVGGKEGVSDQLLESIRAHGAQIVERVAGADVETTKALLNQMADEGRRFLGTPSKPPQAPQEETYTVQPGDTLIGISLKVYGDQGHWRAIFEANRDLLDDPGRIRPGHVLRIPSVP